MRLQGIHYLHDVLRTVVDEIYEERKQCEIDTTRFKDGENLDANLVSRGRCFKINTHSLICSDFIKAGFDTNVSGVLDWKSNHKLNKENYVG